MRAKYEVTVGRYGDKEVDFTARRGAELEYFQVAKTVRSDDTYEREASPLEAVRDNFPKTILSMDGFMRGAPDGIKHKNLIRWLLEE
ncbi:MAG: ATP-binding protein [Candidatus Methanoplasma sp.]|jgi:predicted AAA+ superfamily ATPase|nr:ATP-binding protein [Candidatus Methanoplasma sp.]